MALLRVDAEGRRPVTASGTPLREVMEDALSRLPEDRPLVIMVHGYKFCPDITGRDPHRHILALKPQSDDRRAVSWPAHLGFRREDAGLAIAFGWDSRGTIWAAARASLDAAAALAGLIHHVRQHRRAPVHIICHSMGARVALLAVRALPIGSVHTVILMAGAAFQDEAQAALSAPAGRTARFLNVSSGENLLFDLLLAAGLRGFLPGSRPIGRGLSHGHPNWVDLQIDRPETRVALARLGYRIARPVRHVCHWSSYLRPGMFPLYRAVFAGRLDITALVVRPRLRRSRLWHRLLPN